MPARAIMSRPVSVVCVSQPRSRVVSAESSSETRSLPTPPSIVSSAASWLIVPAPASPAVVPTSTRSLPSMPSIVVWPSIVRT